MTIATLFLAAAATATLTSTGGESPPPPRGAQIASVQVSAVVLRPAIVRQSTGLEQGAPDAPQPQVSRRGGEVLIEFQ